MQVDDVCSWVTSLDPKVAAYAQAFREQEIDGISLRELEQVCVRTCSCDTLSSLLSGQDHMVKILNLKLGPALKLDAALKQLKASREKMTL